MNNNNRKREHSSEENSFTPSKRHAPLADITNRGANSRKSSRNTSRCPEQQERTSSQCSTQQNTSNNSTHSSQTFSIPQHLPRIEISGPESTIVSDRQQSFFSNEVSSYDIGGIQLPSEVNSMDQSQSDSFLSDVEQSNPNNLSLMESSQPSPGGMETDLYEQNEQSSPNSNISPRNEELLPLSSISGFRPFVIENDIPLIEYPHDDIDLNGITDPSTMSSYVINVHSHYRRREQQSHIENPMYLTANEINGNQQNHPVYTLTQPEITPDMRKVLVNWLHEVSTEFLLKGETLFLTVQFLDRFLSRYMRIERAKFQLVGVTCLFIAGKYEQIQPLPLDQLVHLTAETYTRDKLIDMERIIANVLEFDLVTPTVKVFLSRFIRACRFDARRTLLSNFLAELALLDYNLVRYLPSTIAAACVYLTLLTSGRTWSSTLSYYSQYSPFPNRRETENGTHQPLFTPENRQFLECTRQLLQFWYTERTNGNSVFEKYSTPAFHSVSLTLPYNPN